MCVMEGSLWKGLMPWGWGPGKGVGFEAGEVRQGRTRPQA